MASRLELSVVAKNQASRVLKQVGGDIRGLSKEAGNAKNSFNDMFSVAGGNLLARGVQSATSAVLGLGKAFVGTIADAANASAQMNAQVSGIGAVLGLTQTELVKVKDLINQLGVDPNLKVNAQEAADAIDMLARNGLTLEQILGGAAEATVFLANATGGSFDTSANVATDTMAMFNIKAEDMMSAVNGITSVTVASKFSLDDYRLAIAQAGGVASALGVEFADFNTTIAATSSSFASGSDAGTSFKTFLQRLVPQSNEASEAMAELGLYTFNSEKAMTTLGSMGIKPLSGDMNSLISQLMKGYAATHKVNVGTEEGLQKFNAWAKEAGFVQNSFYDANGQLKDMADISTVLNQATAGLTEEQKNQYLTTIFGSDAMRTAFGLAEKGAVVYTDLSKASKELGVSEADLAKYAEGGITAFEALQATMGKTDALKSAQMRVDNLSGDMEIFGGIVDSVKTQVGDRLQPALRTLFQEMSKALTFVTPQILAFGDALGTRVTKAVARLTAAFNVFKAGGGIADIGKALGISPGVIAVIETVIQHIDLLKGALKGMAVAIGAGVAIAGVTAAITGLLNPITLVMAGAALLGAAWETNFGNIQGITADVAESIGNVVTAIQDFLAGADISAATTTLTQSFTGVKNALGELFTGDIGISEFASKITDAVSGIPDMVRNVFAGADFSAMKGEIITALGLDNVSFDLSALQTNISTAIGGIDWSQVAAQFNTLKDSVGTALNSVRDGVLSSLTAAVNGIDWSAISLDFAGMIDSVTSTINGIDWSQISIEDIGLALAGVVMPVLTNSIRGIVWVLNSDSWSGLTASVKSALASIEWGEIGQSLSGLGAAAIDAVTGLDWSTITGAFESLRSSVSSTISGLDWSTVTGAFGTLVSTVTGALSSIDWSTVATEFNSLKTSVVTAISDIDWTAVTGAFAALKTNTVNALSTLDWSTIAGSFDALKTSVVNTISGIDWSGVSTGFTALKTSVVDTVSGIDWSGVSTGFTALKTSVSTAIANIDWAGIAQNLNGLAAAVSAGVSSIDWSGVSSAFDALKTTVSSTLTGINWSEVLQDFVASANTLRDNLIQSLADKINGIDWSQISLNVAGFINKIASTISSIDWSQAVVNVAGFISSISSKISSIDWSQISVGAIGAALAAVVAPALTAGIAGIIWVLSSENWGNLLSAVTDSIAEIDWGPIGEAFGNLATAVVDSVTNIDWSPISSAFGSLVTSVVNAITNLDWSGVSAPFAALGTKIQDAVNYALSTISFGFLGGGSPPPPPPTKTNASGTKSFEGGLTWVDERGAELFRFPDGQWAMGSDKGAHLMDLPKGTEIYSHEDSKKMLGMGGLTPIGQNADGTTTAATVAPTGNGNVFSAIASAANNFVKASDKLGKAGQVISDSMKDLEANLRKVPGLFGASQVTEQQMKMGALGVPQNFADDWLRRLTDEVVNGVNWEGVDIKDAALRAGLDPGLPAEAILELVTQKWNDKSLFANAANLDLINQDAVKAALEAQAQQAAGEQNLLNLLGVTPEQARTAGAATGTAAGGGMLTGITQSLTGSGAGTQVATSIATGVTPESMAPVGGSVVSALATELGKEEYGVQMGAALAGLFTGYLDKADAFVDVAQRIMSKIAAQFSNVGALDMVARFVESFRAQLGSKDAISSLTAVGEKILELVFRGYLDESLRRNWAEGVNAKGDTSNKQGGQSTTNQGSGSNTNTPPTTAGNAIGTSSWRGGMTWVGETGPELVSLPPRTRIFNPAESMALAGGGGDVYVTVNATVSNAVDVEQLAYRVVDVIRKRR